MKQEFIEVTSSNEDADLMLLRIDTITAVMPPSDSHACGLKIGDDAYGISSPTYAEMKSLLMPTDEERLKRAYEEKISQADFDCLMYEAERQVIIAKNAPAALDRTLKALDFYDQLVEAERKEHVARPLTATAIKANVAVHEKALSARVAKAGAEIMNNITAQDD